MAEIQTEQGPIREYLCGDLLSFLTRLIESAKAQGGKVYLALYELDDKGLVDCLIANRSLLDIILSNSSADRDTGEWDSRNAPARKKLNDAGVKVKNRLFNNGHIGHNKFAVYVDGPGKPRAVIVTGGANWTTLGLCGQTNNSIILENDDVAAAYLRYWNRLKDDEEIKDPQPPSAPGHGNVQSRELLEGDRASRADVLAGRKCHALVFAEYDRHHAKYE